MRSIAWLIVSNRAESATADSARRCHGFEAGTVFLPEGSILTPGVIFHSIFSLKKG